MYSAVHLALCVHGTLVYEYVYTECTGIGISSTHPDPILYPCWLCFSTRRGRWGQL